jgi:hypothetical protein
MQLFLPVLLLISAALFVSANDKKHHPAPACNTCAENGKRACGTTQNGNNVIIECQNKCWIIV